MILRDTPGYGVAGERKEPFSRLRGEIEECDLLVMVCTARSAARQADRGLLGEIHRFFARDPKRLRPPMVCVLTHADALPEHLRAEALAAVAADLGLGAGQIAAACTQWGRLADLDGVLSAIRGQVPDAERLKIARCIRQIRKEQDEDKLLGQLLGGLRLAGGWIGRTVP
jgi:hypothetical protein